MRPDYFALIGEQPSAGMAVPRRPGDWSTRCGPSPGVRRKGNRWEVRFSCGKRHGWVSLGYYPSEWEAGRIARKVQALPLAMRRQLAGELSAKNRRKLAARLLREHAAN